jgi:hypothetical protein
MKDPDKMHQEYYNKDTLKGIEIGKKHQSPSPLTLQFMEQTKLFNQEIKQEVEYIKQQLKKIPTTDEMTIVNKTMIESVFKRMDEMLEKHEEKSDAKYAVKTVEKIVYALAGMVLTSFGAGLIALVFKAGLL